MRIKFILLASIFIFIKGIFAAEGLHFDYLKKSDLTSPSQEIKKRLGDYSNKSYCDKQRSYFSDFHQVIASGNEMTENGINSCLASVKSDPGFKCFSYELETKKREQDCHRKKNQILDRTARKNYDLNSCISDARLWGNKQLKDNECGRKLKWAGNIHMLRMLTLPKMERFCDLKSSSHTINLWLNSRDGNWETSQSYKGDFSKLHWTYYKCIKQACYDSVKKYYPKYVNTKQAAVSKCSSDMSLSYGGCVAETRNNGAIVKHCTYKVPIPLTKEDFAVKSTVTDRHRNLAKRFAGKYINNTKISLGKTSGGKQLSGHAWVITNLDTKGEFVNAHLNISLTGDDIFKYTPYINSQKTVEWSNKSLNQIKWEKVGEEEEKALIAEFEASKKLTWNFRNDSKLGKPVIFIKNKKLKTSNNAQVTKVDNKKVNQVKPVGREESKVIGSQEKIEQVSSKASRENPRREGKPAQVVKRIYKGSVYSKECWLGRHGQTLKTFQMKASNLSLELQDEITKAGCSKDNNTNCNKEEIRTILTGFKNRGRKLTNEMDSWRKEEFSMETVDCTDSMPNVKSMLKHEVVND